MPGGSALDAGTLNTRAQPRQRLGQTGDSEGKSSARPSSAKTTSATILPTWLARTTQPPA